MRQANLNRVLQGMLHRYDEVSADAPGTKVLTVVSVMKESGLAVQAASAYVQLKLGVQVTTGAGGGAPTDENQSNNDIKVLAAAMSAPASAAAGPSVASPATSGPGAPRPLQPPQIEEGNMAHELIGGVYCTANPFSAYDASIADILAMAKGQVPGLAKAIKDFKSDLFRNIDVRPDITDLRRMQIFEIKPAGFLSLALEEAAEYVALLDSLGLPQINFTLGNPGNPGTRGAIPGPDGVLVWASPAPGAIIYRIARPPEAPETVRERINNGAYEEGLGLARKRSWVWVSPAPQPWPPASPG